MKLTNIERETIIVYNEAEPTATVTTYSPALQRKLDKLTLSSPVFACLEKGDGFGVYSCPKKQVKFAAPRFISDEKRQIMAERLRARKREAK